MASFLIYLWALFPKWYALATLGGLGLVSALFPKWQQWADRHEFGEARRRSAFFSLLTMAILWAGFEAWNEEHDARLTAVRELSAAQANEQRISGVADARQAEINRLSSNAARPIQQIPAITREMDRERRETNERAATLTQLRRLYAEGAAPAANIWARPRGGNGADNPYFAANAAAATRWMERTAAWIRSHLGQAAVDRFYEQDTSPAMSFDGMTEEQGAFAMRVTATRRNLREMIDSGGWDDRRS